MKKRELKQKIYDLKVENGELLSQVNHYKDLAESAQRSLDEALNRLYALGNKFEPLEGVDYVEAKIAKPWGTYVPCYKDSVSGKALDDVKKRIASGLVEGLIDKGYVQFIVNDSHLLAQTIVGAKLYVIPWDKAVRRKEDDR